MTSEQISAQLAQNLPNGTSAQAVVDYINENDLSSDGPVNLESLRPVKDAPQTSDLLAIVRDVRKSALVSTAVQMRFVFDDEQKLIETSVREINTGL
ncbi:MAG: hypothetical protein AAGL68_03435 [Pseudomonadota bacterium]